MQPLSLAVAQPISTLGDVSANVEAHVAELVAAPGARIVVFPELSLTGYGLDHEPIDPLDRRLAPLVEASRSTGAIALCGAPVVSGRGVSVGVLRVDGRGVEIVYRKLFLGGDEPSGFRPGRAPAAIDVDGWRLGLAVCKDLGVPSHADLTAELGIDAYIAGVCELAADRDVPVERARRVADDHGVWVAVASFAGPTGGGFDDTAGGSFVMSPGGTIVAQADGSPGRTEVVDLEPSD